MRHFLRARGRISDQGNHDAHISALAYASDSYFIGTASTVHALPSFSAEQLRAMLNTVNTATTEQDKAELERALNELGEDDIGDLRRRLEAELERVENPQAERKPTTSMVVSLDHSIFFHNPRAFRVDDWFLTEMESPWAGAGRALVVQRIWARDGTLIATCTQEVCCPFSCCCCRCCC